MEILIPDSIVPSIAITQTPTGPSVLPSICVCKRLSGDSLKSPKNVTEVSKNRNSEESALPAKSILGFLKLLYS